MPPFHPLTQLGYKFENDQLIKLDDATTQYIEELLMTTCGLQCVILPLDAGPDDVHSEIYMSPDALTSEKPLLLLIPGISIKVGQWARKIIINESLSKGSMLEYIQEATENGFNVLIFNSNKNRMGNRPIRGSEDPVRHVEYVWKNIVRNSSTKDILIVAHSYGGVCVGQLLDKNVHEMKDRVKAIALTDSVHSNLFQNADAAKLMKKIGTNWVRSRDALDKPCSRVGNGCPFVSAGTTSHEHTTVVAKDSVFKFLKSRLH
ncbi:hypothetical protein HDU97_007406 [Phlyctochytrium planicorne]|nr:hypothetical protein HDU97_007406 [Phlyctochytrium planicorne]